MRPMWPLYLVMLGGLAGWGMSRAAPADLHSVCATIPVEVVSGSPADHALVCNGARWALGFFGRHRIEMTRRVQVQLHDAAITDRDAHIGLYDVASRRIDLLTLAQAERLCSQQSPFDLPMDASLYLSFVVHEVAHAVVDQNLKVTPLPWVAHEYIASVAQFASLPDDRRAIVLQQWDLAPFEGVEQMSEVFYGLDPAAFTVKAYRHFLALQDRTAFLRALLGLEGTRWTP